MIAPALPNRPSDGRNLARDRADRAFRHVIGESRALRSVVEYARTVALRGAGNVLLVGEAGTGKGLLARAIHASSPRADEPFAAVDCGAVTASFLASEIFGHEAGAVSGGRSRKAGLVELVGAGTVFLDAIGRLDAVLQPKLLRAVRDGLVRRVGGIEELEIRCSFIVASGHALEESVAGGSFRDDLFAALNGVRITLPPLRDRDGDVDILAEHFLEEIARNHGLEPKVLSGEARSALRSYEWPGNVRELKAVIGRAALTAPGPIIGADHLRIQTRRELAMSHTAERAPTRSSRGMTLAELEAEAIRSTLADSGGDLRETARVLGITVASLRDRALGLGVAIRSEAATSAVSGGRRGR